MDSTDMNPVVVLSSVDPALDSTEVVQLVLSLGPSVNPQMELEDIHKVQLYAVKMKKNFTLMSKLNGIMAECTLATMWIYGHIWRHISRNWTAEEKVRKQQIMKKHFYKILKKLLLELPYLIY